MSINKNLENYLDSIETKAFLVIKNDTIIAEFYKDGYTENTPSNSFSMAKTYVSTLIGIALTQNRISSLDEPISKYVEEMRTNDKKNITIRHCLTMSSGLDWNENYANPFSTVSKAYYGQNLSTTIKDLNLESEPGSQFRYKGSDSQLLAMLIEKIYHKRLANVLSDELWKPLGAEHEALWSLDNSMQTTKASCCLFTNARDIALLGKLYLQNGYWNNQIIIDSNYIKQATEAIHIKNEQGILVDYYGYQWWLHKNQKNEKILYARGVGGQYLMVLPASKIIIVRLGKKRGEKVGNTFKEVNLLANTRW
jgi:CubicO group peptidase (beta-lactamase class C family)